MAASLVGQNGVQNRSCFALMCLTLRTIWVARSWALLFLYHFWPIHVHVLLLDSTFTTFLRGFVFIALGLGPKPSHFFSMPGALPHWQDRIQMMSFSLNVLCAAITPPTVTCLVTKNKQKNREKPRETLIKPPLVVEGRPSHSLFWWEPPSS